MSEWTNHGNWNAKLEQESFRIFPKGPDGKTMVVTIRRVYIRLQRKCNNGAESLLSFKHYLHQKNRYWADSRHEKGSCTKHHVRKELARLLFSKDQEKAAQYLAQAESLL